MGSVSQTLRSVIALGAGLAMLGCDGKSSAPAPAVVPAAASLSQGGATPETILKLSPGAADRLRALRDKNKLKAGAIVRIGVLEGKYFRMKNGGEKRFQYTLSLDDDPKNQADYFAMESQGLTVQVPKSSADFLRGTEVIWIESGGKGGFKFQNPNQLSEDEAQIVPEAESARNGEASKPAADKAPTGQTPTPINETPTPGIDAGRDEVDNSERQDTP